MSNVNEFKLPSRDSRELNVVEKIKELSELQKPICCDDSVEKDELDLVYQKLYSKLHAEVSSGNSDVSTLEQNLSTLSQNLSTVSQNLNNVSQSVTDLGPKKVFRTSDMEFVLDENNATTTESLYDTLKNTMSEGDICIGEVNISDGPAGASEHLGIFAYATTDNITDGDSIYSRIYIIATEKTVAPYFWYYNTGVWRSIMLMEDYENFKIKSSTPGSTKKFEVSIDDTGTLHATEII